MANLFEPSRYIAVEGPIRVGKSTLSRFLATRLHGQLILEAEQNPFLPAFYNGDPGAAFQAQLTFLVGRYEQLRSLADRNSQKIVVTDYIFEKSKLFAYLNLEDSELMIHEKLYGLLAEGVPKPDLVVYLQASTEVLMKRIRARGRPEESRLSEEYLAEVNRAYNYYFFHYNLTPLLVVNTSEVDFVKNADDLDDLLKQIKSMGKGTQYYVPMASRG
jgi:deoxyadenosine/deoxycytidine kinase